MARSPQDDPIFSDMQRNAWNYRHNIKAGENTAPGALNDMNQSSLTSDTGALNENNMYVNQNLLSNDVYMNKNAYCPPTLDSPQINEENLSYNNMTNPPRNNYGNAMLSLDNGPFVRVFYDTSNQQLIIPNHQYDLYNRNQCMQDMSMQNVQPNHNMYTEYSNMNNNIHVQQTSITNNVFNQDNDNSQTHIPTSKILKEFLGNLEPKPNSTGSYSPFGQNYPLNHPDAPTINILKNNAMPMETPILSKQENSPKRNENSPLADTSNKKRIVAEVKPMRPTYSDVLAKNAKNSQSDAPRKTKQQNVDAKPANIKCNNKNEKHTGNIKYSNDEIKHKNEKKQPSTISSGSESGDVNIDDVDKQHKQNKKSKNKRSNMSRKWSSIDDIPNEGENVYNNDNGSQFVFIETQPEKPIKKEKKNSEHRKNSDSKIASEEESKQNEDNQSEFVFQENQNDSSKVKKKKEKSHHKLTKPVQDKKKNVQNKWRRNKPGYLGLVQNYLEHWSGATWKALIWFIYLISDVCRMSAHLSFDLCTSVFTQTYVSSQAVWRSTKDWLYRIGDNKYLVYIDRKFGHTRFGFWRKLKWFKKESETDVGDDSTKLNANIPLPATGEEAMKRLLACKGKDPYSILGVSVACTDDDIKRYYRRQAFLVHPDKNQQPGAEEAFKILQHAFDLIGEPERRAAYERRAQESRHAEAAWGELGLLLAQLHDKMEYAANTIRCTNCGRRHKRVLTERPCYAARYCAQCKIRHSAKEGDIWAESSLLGLLVMYYACMDGAVYQITQWASCQKKNLMQLRPDGHVVQYRIVLGSRAAAAPDAARRPSTGNDPNLEEFLNNFYSKSGVPGNTASANPPATSSDAKKRRNKKPKA